MVQQYVNALDRIVVSMHPATLSESNDSESRVSSPLRGTQQVSGSTGNPAPLPETAKQPAAIISRKRRLVMMAMADAEEAERRAKRRCA